MTDSLHFPRNVLSTNDKSSQSIPCILSLLDSIEHVNTFVNFSLAWTKSIGSLDRFWSGHPTFRCLPSRAGEARRKPSDRIRSSLPETPPVLACAAFGRTRNHLLVVSRGRVAPHLPPWQGSVESCPARAALRLSNRSPIPHRARGRTIHRGAAEDSV